MGKAGRGSRPLALGLWLLAVAACSSGSGSPILGGGGGTLDCSSLCQKYRTACPNSVPPDCESECQSEISGATCGSELNVYGACLQSRAVVSCDADGDLKVQGCDAEAGGYVACLQCQPEPDDDACDTCEKTQCCDEGKALYTHPDAPALGDCLDACSDSSCSDACRSQYPSLTQLAQDYSACISSCLDQC